jgi:hypothetical protein
MASYCTILAEFVKFRFPGEAFFNANLGNVDLEQHIQPGRPEFKEKILPPLPGCQVFY